MSGPTRLVIDIQALQNPLHRDRGIGRYLVDHVDALLAAGAPIAALTLNPIAPAPRLPAAWHTAGLVQWRRLGLSDSEILARHPDLGLADLATAWEYEAEHCDELDQAIREDEDA